MPVKVFYAIDETEWCADREPFTYDKASEFPNNEFSAELLAEAIIERQREMWAGDEYEVFLFRDDNPNNRAEWKVLVMVEMTPSLTSVVEVMDDESEGRDE